MPSFDDAYRRWFPLIRAKCRRMLAGSAEAEELAQETFLRFWKEGLGEVEARSALGWMYKTATRMAIDRLRARQVRTRLDPVTDLVAATLPAAEVSFVRDALHQLAKTIDADALEAAVLCRADGLSQAEAAALVGASERTIRRRLDAFDTAAAPLRKEWLS